MGLYTSPHLQEFTERIQINGMEIDKAELVALVNRLRPLTQQVPEITTFELTTALGFLYFTAEQQVDIAVIEVGLGGRLDATNIINPLVSVITPFPMTIALSWAIRLQKSLTKKAASSSRVSLWCFPSAT